MEISWTAAFGCGSGFDLWNQSLSLVVSTTRRPANLATSSAFARAWSIPEYSVKYTANGLCSRRPPR
jgi:hypothetical protein